MRSLALAGKPNAGKSTFYAAATMADVEVGNYPFTTIDANRGVSYVRTECPCAERDRRCDAETCRAGKRYVPVTLIDVAGLVPGAHEGRGLGNQFLDAMTDADVVINVVDAAGATTAEGEPVDVGTNDPLRDVDFVETEMEEWLTDIVRRNWETVERRSRSPDFDLDEALADVLTGFGATETDVATILRNVAYPETPQSWGDSELQSLATALRRQTKPFVIAANKADIAPDDAIDRFDSVERPVIPTSAEGELALRRGADAGVVEYDPGDSDFTITGELSASQTEALEVLREMMSKYGGTGVQETLNTAVYDVLDQITVYPVRNESKWTDASGAMLPDAVLLDRGATPPDLARHIHSDIADGYLHAVDAKSGRRIGEDAELAEGDVIKIVSTAT